MASSCQQLTEICGCMQRLWTSWVVTRRRQPCRLPRRAGGGTRASTHATDTMYTMRTVPAKERCYEHPQPQPTSQRPRSNFTGVFKRTAGVGEGRPHPATIMATTTTQSSTKHNASTRADGERPPNARTHQVRQFLLDVYALRQLSIMKHSGCGEFCSPK